MRLGNLKFVTSVENSSPQLKFAASDENLFASVEIRQLKSNTADHHNTVHQCVKHTLTELLDLTQMAHHCMLHTIHSQCLSLASSAWCFDLQIDSTNNFYNKQ